SWILLGGVLPVERWRLTLGEIGPGMRFVEISTTLLLRRWRHERSVEAVAGTTGARVTDRLSFETAGPGLAGLLGGTLPRFSAHRHRRLQGRSGALDPKRGGTQRKPMPTAQSDGASGR